MENHTISKFNIRVYGLIIHQGSVLVTDEYRMGQYLTKFPGGGMHFGEGTLECLKRECREEMGQEIKIRSHFYTTDFFQPTFFLPETEQLISIYYLADLNDPAILNVSTKAFDFDELTDGAQCFRWIPLHQLTEDEFTLPVDKVVAGLLKGNQLMENLE